MLVKAASRTISEGSGISLIRRNSMFLVRARSMELFSSIPIKPFRHGTRTDAASALRPS